MKIYDTLSLSLKELEGKSGKKLKMFVCGPTVYDKPHLGHAKTNIFFDVLAKFLRFKGYRVFYLMNITDIDDKIISRAIEEGRGWNDVVSSYSSSFFEIMKILRIDSVNYYAFATDYISEIIDQIDRLEHKGLAYETNDGVYFSVRGFKDYGKLSHQSIDSLISGARISINENKKDPLDFALWKKRKPGEPYWESPWGQGRPGWHIEDTAITESIFGPQYDIHGGGADLIFPHHESEIAQMEGVSGKVPMVNYWIHTGHLNVENVKMSKSLKNFVSPEDLLKRFWPEAIRIYLLSMQYRSTANYSEKGLIDGQIIAEKISLLKHRVKKYEPLISDNSVQILDNIISPLENDMNTQESLVLINDFLKESLSIRDRSDKINGEINYVLNAIDGIFAIVHDPPLPESAADLILSARNEARKKGDFGTADDIRKKLGELGIRIEDSTEGSFLWW